MLLTYKINRDNRDPLNFRAKKKSMLIFFSIITVAVNAAPVVPNVQKLFDLIDARQKAFDIPGMAVSVIEPINSDGPGKRKLSFHTKGFTNIDTKQPFTTTTLFPCASMTKLMTAHAVGVLVDSKNTTWEQPISTNYRIHFNNATWNDTVNLLDLLSHRTGLDPLMEWAAADLPVDDIITAAEQAPSVSTFRDSFNYNNHFFSLVGRMMSKGSSDPFDGWKALIKTHIFDKLGMNSSTVEASDYFNGQNTAFPHMYSPEPISSNGSYVVKPKNVTSWAFTKVAPAAGVVSSIEDFSKWLSYLLDSFKGNAKTQIVSKESHDMIFKNHTKEFQYGLGVFSASFGNETFYSHTGDADGVTSIFCLFPKTDLALVIVHNSNNKALFGDAECAHIFEVLVHGNGTRMETRTSFTSSFWDQTVGMTNNLARSVRDYVKNQTTNTTLPIESYIGVFNSTGSDKYGFNVTLVNSWPLILNFEVVYPFKVQPTLPSYKSYKMLHQGGDGFSIIYGTHSFPSSGDVKFVIEKEKVVGINITAPLPLSNF